MKAALDALRNDYDSYPQADELISIYNALKTAFDAGYEQGFDYGRMTRIEKGEPIDEVQLATMMVRDRLAGNPQDWSDEPAKENAHVEGAEWPDDDTAD